MAHSASPDSEARAACKRKNTSSKYFNCFGRHLLRLANIQQAQLPVKGCSEKHGLLGWMPPSLPRR